MMYCPECGCKIDDPAIRFCPECGTRTGQDDSVGAPVSGNAAEAKAADTAQAYGLVFTNVRLLASKLKAGEEDIKQIIEQFVEHKKRYGVSYRLIDAGNWSMPRQGLFGGTRTVSLDAGSSLGEYMDILSDVHFREINSGGPVSEYLFIIGSADIIPMPKVTNYLSDQTGDADVETDLLYAYPYEKDLLRKVESMEIFNSDALFHVGRLPLGEDATFGQLVDWLARAVACSAGIPVGSAYAQCDPNWMNVTARVAQDLRDCGLMPDSSHLPDKYSRYGILLSPMMMVENGTADTLVNTGASIYYFNMHGSNVRGERGYSGQALPEDGKGWCHGIMPENLAACETFNIVVSEACYGARFNALGSTHSMLLSAMKASTMIFMGSSRVAWGSVDSKGDTPQTAGASSADVMAQSFIAAMLSGYPAGAALFVARCNLIRQAGFGDPYAGLSVLEFNLFGDPTLFMVWPESAVVAGKAVPSTKGYLKPKESSLVPGSARKEVYEMEKVRDGTSGTSILDMVRDAIDRNILRVREDIARHLYEGYGISPREPESIFRVRYHDGRQNYLFLYKVGVHEDGRPCLVSVSSGADGKVKRVLSTK